MLMFFPGETIVHQFIIPFDIVDVAKVIVTYKQNDQIVMEKTITSGFTETEDNKTSFDYSFMQPESLAFQDNSNFTIQLNVYSKGGTRHASHEMKESSGVQYYREVIEDE